MAMGLVLDLLISALALFVVGLYVWSTMTHFRSETPPKGVPIVATAVFLSLAIFLMLLWMKVQPVAAQLAGLALIFSSLGLFWWAINASRDFGLTHVFDKTQPTALLSSGPYAYVRHPFYTSYIIFWGGFALSTWSVWAVVPLAAIIVIYTKASRLEEAKFFNSPLADSYRAYMLRAGRFWPKLG